MERTDPDGALDRVLTAARKVCEQADPSPREIIHEGHEATTLPGHFVVNLEDALQDYETERNKHGATH